MLSPVRLSSVCRLTVTLVRPTQPAEIFGNVSTPFGTVPWPSVDIHEKIYGDRPRRTPPSGGGVNATGSQIEAISQNRWKIEGKL